MLRVNWMGCELELPVISSTALLRMMVELTMHRIMFPLGLQVIFLPLYFSTGGLIVISWQSISNDPPLVYVMFCWGNASSDIYKGRHGMSCTAPTCFHGIGIQSLFLGKRLALKLISLYADRIL